MTLSLRVHISYTGKLAASFAGLWNVIITSLFFISVLLFSSFWNELWYFCSFQNACLEYSVVNASYIQYICANIYILLSKYILPSVDAAFTDLTFRKMREKNWRFWNPTHSNETHKSLLCNWYLKSLHFRKGTHCCRALNPVPHHSTCPFGKCAI